MIRVCSRMSPSPVMSSRNTAPCHFRSRLIRLALASPSVLAAAAMTQSIRFGTRSYNAMSPTRLQNDGSRHFNSHPNSTARLALNNSAAAATVWSTPTCVLLSDNNSNNNVPCRFTVNRFILAQAVLVASGAEAAALVAVSHPLPDINSWSTGPCHFSSQPIKVVQAVKVTPRRHLSRTNRKRQ